MCSEINFSSKMDKKLLCPQLPKKARLILLQITVHPLTLSKAIGPAMGLLEPLLFGQHRWWSPMSDHHWFNPPPQAWSNPPLSLPSSAPPEITGVLASLSTSAEAQCYLALTNCADILPISADRQTDLGSSSTLLEIIGGWGVLQPINCSNLHWKSYLALSVSQKIFQNESAIGLFESYKKHCKFRTYFGIF